MRQTRTPEQVDTDVWRRIDTSDAQGCWPWTGAVNRRNGFGQFYYLGKRGPHRWIMERAGHAVTGAEVRHHCGNPACCRPDHLFIWRDPGSDAAWPGVKIHLDFHLPSQPTQDQLLPPSGPHRLEHK